MENRSVPTNTVLPHVNYQNVAAACDWLIRAFGFREIYPHGDPVSGIMGTLGNAPLMLHRAGKDHLCPTQLGYGTQMLTIIVEDADTHYKKAVAAGATIVEELHETIYGERQYGVQDIEGHRWLFSQHAHDADPTEWGAQVSKKALNAMT
ncbi:MAG: VOC family protein [Terracidiphilus sp.]|jgi:uncharacterized glyoxalase superfamily protein PhnB